MRRTILGAALLLALLPAAGARDDKDKPKPDKPAGAAAEFKTLAAEYNDAVNELYKPLRDAKTQAEAEKIIEKEMTNEKQEKLQADFGKRMFAFVEKNAGERDAVADALLWIMQKTSGSADSAKAADLLIRDHLANKKLDSAIGRLVYMPTDSGEKLVRAVAEKADTPARKTNARLQLARLLKNKYETVGTIKTSDEKTLRMFEKRIGKEYLARLAASDPATFSAEAELLFAAIVKDAAEDKTIAASIKESAETELYELRFLAIGKPAPDIEGEGIDGKSFKLSDYRGKVVVLDFWGNW